MADIWGAESGGEMLQSPIPMNSGTAWQTSVPAVSSGNWMDILRMLASSGGRGIGTSAPFASLTPQLSPQPGVPLYSMPPAVPIESEQQKQTSPGEVDQYAKIIAGIFGLGG
jgi:hypothetical protein